MPRRIERLVITKENTMLYLCAYYALKPTKCFGNTAINFPSHKQIYNILAEKSGLPSGSTIESMMEKCGYKFGHIALEEYRLRRKQKSPHLSSKRKPIINEWEPKPTCIRSTRDSLDAVDWEDTDLPWEK